jgi:hypothetical protein
VAAADPEHRAGEQDGRQIIGPAPADSFRLRQADQHGDFAQGIKSAGEPS